MSIQAIIKDFEDTYISGQYENPPKISIPLRVDPETGEHIDYCNVMVAKLKDGYYGTKTISIAQSGDCSQAVLSTFNHDGSTIHRGADQDFLRATMMRCALISKMVIDKDPRVQTDRLTIGVIGLGNIGQMCIDLLSEHHILLYARGITERAKAVSIANSFSLKYFSIVSTYRAVCASDYVITATNANQNSPLIEFDDLNQVTPTKFISFDSGYIVGPSIRESYLYYFDSKSQGWDYLHDEDEFPHDDTSGYVGSGGSMRDLLTEDHSKESYSLYITGMAVFDLILSRYLPVYQHYLSEFEAKKV